MAEATSGTISVVCSCGKKLKAPASAAGKKAKCPNCGNVLTVTAPPPPPEEDNSLDALYDLAQESEQHAQQQQLAPRCPQCMREMGDGAVICTNCGYDTRTGKAITPKVAAATGTKYDPAAAAAAAASASKNKKTGDKMAPQGSFIKGLAASAGGAFLGALVWFLVAWGTGWELYILVLLVGGLAGLGMQWGQEGYSYAGGAAAAAITFVVMIIARIAVVLALIVPQMMSERIRVARQTEEERMPDLSEYDERIVQQLYLEQRKVQKPVAPAPAPAKSDEDEEESDEPPVDRQEVAIYQAVEKKLKAMPKPQYDAWVKKLDAEEKADRLQHYVTDDIIKTVIGTHPSRASSVEYESAVKAATEKIAGMTQAQRDAEYTRLDAEHAKARANALAQMKKEREERAASRGRTVEDEERAASGAAAAIGAIVIFFLVFGGFRGVIFTLLALGLAYRTASGSVSD
ncbi:MAG: hypothetical protein QOF78_3599 [Phycisphaerales bacterium]|nr:hypothetical protein [Phycisphaerales bacterium]